MEKQDEQAASNEPDVESLPQEESSQDPEPDTPTPKKEHMKHDELAGTLYETYCESVGGKAYNGDDLPSWADFSADDNKICQANAWRKVAATASLHLNPPAKTGKRA